MLKEVSELTYRRFPKYVHVLRLLQKEGKEYTSASELSRFLDIHHTQIRKDLALTGVVGVPKRGHRVDNLLRACIEFLDWDNLTDACIIGVGNMGSALLKYEGFGNAGLQIVAAFDNDDSKVDSRISNVRVFSTEKMCQIIDILELKIAIITTPAKYAQSIADEIVKAGIKGIWNFSPCKINVPDGVVVENMDIYPTLAALLGRVRTNLILK